MSAADPLRSAAEAAAEAAAPGRIAAVRVTGGRATAIVDVSGLDAARADTVERMVRDAVNDVEGVGTVAVARTAARGGAPDAAPDLAPAAPRLIAVGSGKGGVGKSTLSANLAVALARMGRRVGLVDADIYGPSQPVLMGREDGTPDARDKRLVPVDSGHGFGFLSMGQLAAPGTPVAWRGPMAGNALSQLIDAHWTDGYRADGQGARELIVDLPPGTGDIQLSMIQKHKPAGAVIVSTPQDLSLIDAARAIAFFDKAGVPVIGMVENMAGYVCPHCGEASDPFGNGGAEAAADRMGIAFLGRIPLDIAIRRASDDGTPPAAGDTPQGAAFLAIARKVAEWIDGQGV